MDSQNYLSSLDKQFKYYRTLAESTFAQLSDEELFLRPKDSVNSIAMIVKHMAGNMMSRFSDFLTTDGEKPWRNRDQEFNDSIVDRAELQRVWEEGWDCMEKALQSITADHFTQLVYIRNQGHTLPEALNRQMAHYAYHVGQIVWIGTYFREEKWHSLSIAKGKSHEFNSTLFAKEKQRGHFTDGLTSEHHPRTE